MLYCIALHCTVLYCIVLYCIVYFCLKVRLQGTRQAARLARDMLQRDLLRSNGVYMVGSCRARLLHIIHVSGFWGRCSSKKTEATARDSMCRAAFISSNLNCRPGSQQSRVCCVLRVAVWTLLLYSYVSIFAARLSRRSRAACRVPCKLKHWAQLTQKAMGDSSAILDKSINFQSYFSDWWLRYLS